MPYNVTFSTLFSTTHRYTALSVLLTFLIESCLPSWDKSILELLLVSTECPFLVHDILVAGVPVALQNIITSPPSVPWIICRRGLILGLSTTVRMREAKSPAHYFSEKKVTFTVASKEGGISDPPHRSLNSTIRDQNVDRCGMWFLDWY